MELNRGKSWLARLWEQLESIASAASGGVLHYRVRAPARYVFIVGCARSGTSILGELLAQHPDVKYLFEAHRLWETAGHDAQESHRLTARQATPEVAGELRRQLEALREGAPCLVLKNPRNTLRIPFLRAVFPEARIVHIVRDGRDVSCSLVPGCGGAEWRHLRPPGWKRAFAESSGAVRCARVWKETLEIALDDLRGTAHLQVGYEDLVASPAAAARRLLDYLGLSAHPQVMAFCSRIQDRTEGSYQAKGAARWFRDDHARRVGRWRENLSPPEQEEISRLLGPLLQRLGYAAAAPRAP